MDKRPPPPLRSWVPNLGRAALAVIVIVAVYVVEPSVNHGVRALLNGGRTMAPAHDNSFALVPMSLFLAIRCLCYAAGFLLVRWLLRRDKLLRSSTPGASITATAKGLAIGTAVMVGIILAIDALHGGTITYDQADTSHALVIALGWLGCSVLGATAEEVLYRGMILATLDRLAGRYVAVLGSALIFALSHMSNPGASKLWLIRLFVQGLLLAYAVVRTRSLAWSIGYHAGWNFASAPLLGAPESGYVADGHLFSFTATGPVWLTGGDVGPEGSVFAFAAMALAYGLLLAWTTRRRDHVPAPCQPVIAPADRPARQGE